MSSAQSIGASSGTSRATSHIEMTSEGSTHAIGRGKSRGTSTTEGFSEVFTTQYQWMELQMYSLEEQCYRLAGDLASLPRRECLVKIEDERPFRTRTADLTPAFRSVQFQRVMVPLFIRATSERSPYLSPAAEVDAAIAARASSVEMPCAEADLAAPEPMPQRTVDPVRRTTH